MASNLEAYTLKLIDILDIYQLSQLIDEPTRVTESTETLIDHVITNSTQNLTHHGVLATTISDHYLVYAVRKFDCRRGPPRLIEIRSFKNFNENEFIQDIKKGFEIFHHPG